MVAVGTAGAVDAAADAVGVGSVVVQASVCGSVHYVAVGVMALIVSDANSFFTASNCPVSAALSVFVMSSAVGVGIAKDWETLAEFIASVILAGWSFITAARRVGVSPRRKFSSSCWPFICSCQQSFLYPLCSLQQFHGAASCFRSANWARRAHCKPACCIYLASNTACKRAKFRLVAFGSCLLH